MIAYLKAFKTTRMVQGMLRLFEAMRLLWQFFMPLNVALTHKRAAVAWKATTPHRCQQVLVLNVVVAGVTSQELGKNCH